MPQPRDVFGGENALGPSGRAGSNGVKAVNAGDPTTSPVVVAADKCCAETAYTLDDLIRVGSIADDIAQVPHGIVLGRVREHGLQRLQIGMDIGEK
jgi:hypothetical protein